MSWLYCVQGNALCGTYQTMAGKCHFPDGKPSRIHSEVTKQVALSLISTPTLTASIKESLFPDMKLSKILSPSCAQSCCTCRPSHPFNLRRHWNRAGIVIASFSCYTHLLSFTNLWPSSSRLDQRLPQILITTLCRQYLHP